jgi:hypothetical protein
MVLQQVVEALRSKGKSSFLYGRYLQERICGKPKERIEHSGVGGGPIKLEQEIDSLIDSMSDKELKAYEAAMKVISNLKAKHGKQAA